MLNKSHSQQNFEDGYRLLPSSICDAVWSVQSNCPHLSHRLHLTDIFHRNNCGCRVKKKKKMENGKVAPLQLQNAIKVSSAGLYWFHWSVHPGVSQVRVLSYITCKCYFTSCSVTSFDYEDKSHINMQLG